MTDQTLPDLLSIQAQAVVDRAKALGLTWTLRPATVNVADGASPTVIYDGDTEQVGVTSLVGGLVSQGRVMMLQVPPAGNFVLGRLSTTGSVSVKQIATYRNTSGSTGDVTMSLVPQAASPLVSVTTAGPADYLITATFDMDHTASGGNNLAIGSLQVDGAVVPATAQFGVTAAAQRASVATVWSGQLSSAGAHTFQLFAAKTVNVGTFICRATHTRFSYQVWE